MIPFHQRIVPPVPQGDPYVGRFCRCHNGCTGIVMGRKLVLDNRPGKGDMLRHCWYGINYVTGRSWQSYDPKPLNAGELQKITWAWGGSQNRERREIAVGRVPETREERALANDLDLHTLNPDDRR